MNRLWSPLERSVGVFEEAMVDSRSMVKVEVRARRAEEFDCGRVFLGVIASGCCPRKTCPSCVAHEVAVRV